MATRRHATHLYSMQESLKWTCKRFTSICCFEMEMEFLDELGGLMKSTS